MGTIIDLRLTLRSGSYATEEDIQQQVMMSGAMHAQIRSVMSPVAA